MPDFTRIISLAYQRILGRSADPGGLENYNQLMNAGMTEADMRETLLRSREYEEKNPILGAASTTRNAPSRSRTRSGKKKKARSRR